MYLILYQQHVNKTIKIENKIIIIYHLINKLKIIKILLIKKYKIINIQINC